MKKSKHILVSLTEADFSKVEARAKQENRTLANILYLIITKQLKQEQEK